MCALDHSAVVLISGGPAEGSTVVELLRAEARHPGLGSDWLLGKAARRLGDAVLKPYTYAARCRWLEAGGQGFGAARKDPSSWICW